MRGFKGLTLLPESSLREAIAVIDRGVLQIALIATNGNRLLGTVTDGDIRRAIIRGLPLETPVSQIMNGEFTAVRPETFIQEVLNLMQARGLKQIPVLNSEGRLMGLHVLQDLIGIVELPNWVVIMAGGQGRRLHSLTERVPKPMLAVGERPLLDRTVAQLIAQGFRTIFLAVHYLGDQIQSYFGDGRKFGCEIKYLAETAPLGTGGALSLLPEKPAHSLLVINGDLLTEVNYVALLDYHVQNKCAATLCVREFKYQVPYGVVEVDHHLVLDVEEKPTQQFLINAGIYILEPGVLSLIPRNAKYELPKLISELRRQGKSVGAFPVREYWVDIGRQEDYEQVQGHFNAGSPS